MQLINAALQRSNFLIPGSIAPSLADLAVYWSIVPYFAGAAPFAVGIAVQNVARWFDVLQHRYLAAPDRQSAFVHLTAAVDTEAAGAEPTTKGKEQGGPGDSDSDSDRDRDRDIASPRIASPRIPSHRIRSDPISSLLTAPHRIASCFLGKGGKGTKGKDGKKAGKESKGEGKSESKKGDGKATG